MAQSITYTPNEARAVNDVARHEMIRKLYADILIDLTICELEGWDKREYIKMLQDQINSIKV